MSMMNQEEDGRTWADLPPDVLTLIISKLINSGDVLDRFKVGDQLGWPKRELNYSGFPANVGEQLSKSTILCKFKRQGQGWLLLHRHRYGYLFGGSTCCFNPLLPWPSCFLRLPTLQVDRPEIPVVAAFSASPADNSSGDLRILVSHSCNHFSYVRIRPGPLEQEKYFISGGFGLKSHPLAAEYIETTEGGKFVVLFEYGATLVWETKEDGGLRTMLRVKPLLVNYRNWQNTDQPPLLLRAVGESLMMIWSWSSSSSSFQLVSMEETTQTENHHRRYNDRIREMEEGTTTIHLVRADIIVNISKDSRRLYDRICEFCCCAGMMLLLIGYMIWAVFFADNKQTN